MNNETELRTVLFNLESELQQPSTRCSPAKLEALLSADFVEFTGTGKALDRAAIIDAIQQESDFCANMEQFQIRVLSPTIALVTYQAIVSSADDSESGRSLRSSIWKNDEGRWTMVFHQGTPMASN